ncbi:MAG TPA: methyltransferase domain-containing protein, partial [Planctomycetota bacterium]|nr:methyltransferase domain-containing protein [Planctomycetota bacterium]
GTGELCVHLARQGASVVGFDVRHDALRRARAAAAEGGVSDRCTFLRARGEEMPVASAAADVVVSRSTLQYMDIERAVDEALRVLRPRGRLVLLENLPSHPVIAIVRWRRAHLPRTPKEIAYVGTLRRHFALEDVDRLGDRLEGVEHREDRLLGAVTANLVARAAPRRARWLRAIDAVCARADRWLLDRVPPLRRYAWLTLVLARKPV